MRPDQIQGDAEAVRATLRTLATAGAELRQLDREARLDAIASLRACWLEDEALRTAAVAGLTSESGLAPEMLDLHLRRTFTAWSGPALRALLAEAEHLQPGALAPRSVALVLAVNTPALAVGALFSALALGATAILKPARDRSDFARRLAASAAVVEPRLGAAIAVLPWQGGSGEVEALVLGSVDRIVAYGTAATLAALEARFGSRVRGHGPRASAVVVAAGGRSAGDLAHAIATDTALLDQEGCLSPQWVLVLAPTDAAGLAAALAKALAEREECWPRRRLEPDAAARWRETVNTAEAELLSGRLRALHGAGSRPWAVALETRAELRPTALGRFLRVVAVADEDELEACLRSLGGHLECVGLDAAEPERSRLAARARAAGAQRICRPGAMQDPPAAWRGSGHHPLASLLLTGQNELPNAAANASLELFRANRPLVGQTELSSAATDVGSDPLGDATSAASAEIPLSTDLLSESASDSDGEHWRSRFLRHVAQTSPEPRGLVVVRAAGSRVYTHDGRAWLDLLSGIGVASIGHTHPRVAAAVAAQARRFTHVMVYGEDVLAPQVVLAERLVARLPVSLESVYFTNSGTEAVEGALKLARKHTGRSRVLAFEGAFHGDTTGALALGGNPLYREPFRPLIEGVSHLPWNDPAALARIDDSVAAVIAEPVQAEGGVRLPQADFLPAVAARCREVGALFVLDEVVTAFGRTGRWFAFEHWPGAEPDVLVLAKALGGGLPLGAFVASRELMRSLSENPPLGHVTTFGGNPVCCAAALASLDVLEEDDLPARAARLGETMLDGLRALVGHGGLVAVRGLGLLLGLEFRDAEATRRFVDGCRERGVLVGWTLHHDRVVRLAPPLILSAAETAEALSMFASALARRPSRRSY